MRKTKDNNNNQTKRKDTLRAIEKLHSHRLFPSTVQNRPSLFPFCVYLSGQSSETNAADAEVSVLLISEASIAFISVLLAQVIRRWRITSLVPDLLFISIFRLGVQESTSQSPSSLCGMQVTGLM